MEYKLKLKKLMINIISDNSAKSPIVQIILWMIFLSPLELVYNILTLFSDRWCVGKQKK